MDHEQIVRERIKPKEVPDIRKRLLRSQNNRCPLCGGIIRPDQAVLDHDHGTGRIRAVLHRQCNQVEGRVLSWTSRTGQQVTPYQFLRNMLTYWEQEYEDNPIHPTHKSEIEHEILKLKRKEKKLKSKAGKAKVRQQINEILETMNESTDT